MVRGLGNVLIESEINYFKRHDKFSFFSLQFSENCFIIKLFKPNLK